MYCLNKVELIGRVGNDDLNVVKNSKSQSMLTVSMATSEKWQAEDGSEQERTEWHRCIFFRKAADLASEMLTQGALVYVSGRITYRRYTDNSGNQRCITEIIVSDFMVLGSSNRNKFNADHSSCEFKSDSAVPKQTAARTEKNGLDPYSIGDFDGELDL